MSGAPSTQCPASPPASSAKVTADHRRAEENCTWKAAWCRGSTVKGTLSAAAVGLA